MPATYIDSHTLFASTPFQQRVLTAMLLKAHEVKLTVTVDAEPTADQQMTHHLADRVMGDPVRHANVFAWNIAARPEVSAAPNDAEVLLWVGVVWPYIAGLRPTA